MCAFGNPVCSTAVATWLLVGVSVLAFAAAASAAVWARLAYRNEIEARLGQDDCLDLGKDHKVDKKLYLSPELDLLPNRPLGTKETDYKPFHHAFTNLGRSALGNVRIHVRFFDRDGWPSPQFQVITLGNLGVADSHRERHVELRIHKSLFENKGRVYTKFLAAYTGNSRINEFLKIDPDIPAIPETKLIIPGSQLSMEDLMLSTEAHIRQIQTKIDERKPKGQ